MSKLAKKSLSKSEAIASGPKLHLVKGGYESIADDKAVQHDDIFDYVGLSHPKEVNPSSSEINNGKQSPKHIGAIADVQKFRTKAINATTLKKLYSETYTNWSGMKTRCNADTETGVPKIELHSTFINFADFLECMGPRPYPDWSIDRIDPTGPYAPDNVRWASKTTQARNRTNSVNLTYNDVERPLVEWAEINQVPPATYRQRRRLGWSDGEIIEGARKQAHYNVGHFTSSRDHWQYTPWHPSYREVMERKYQSSRWSGEHRLKFGQRFSMKCANEFMAEIEDNNWPDYYTPSEAQVEKMNKLTKARDVWISIFRYNEEKWAEEFRGALYRSLNIPQWVETKLERFFGVGK